MLFIKRLLIWKTMNRFTKKFFRYFTGKSLQNMSDESFLELIFFIINTYVNRKQPGKALRTLLKIDTYLYAIQGRLAVSYGGGIHTKHKHMNYHKFFTERCGNDDRVLDIGCGIGAVAFDVAKVANYVVGIDLNEENISTAHQRYQATNLKFQVGDALKTLPGDHFNVVILSNVLEHL